MTTRKIDDCHPLSSSPLSSIGKRCHVVSCVSTTRDDCSVSLVERRKGEIRCLYHQSFLSPSSPHYARVEVLSLFTSPTFPSSLMRMRGREIGNHQTTK